MCSKWQRLARGRLGFPLHPGPVTSERLEVQEQRWLTFCSRFLILVIRPVFFCRSSQIEHAGDTLQLRPPTKVLFWQGICGQFSLFWGVRRTGLLTLVSGRHSLLSRAWMDSLGYRRRDVTCNLYPSSWQGPLIWSGGPEVYLTLNLLRVSPRLKNSMVRPEAILCWSWNTISRLMLCETSSMYTSSMITNSVAPYSQHSTRCLQYTSTSYR